MCQGRIKAKRHDANTYRTGNGSIFGLKALALRSFCFADWREKDQGYWHNFLAGSALLLLESRKRSSVGKNLEDGFDKSIRCDQRKRIAFSWLILFFGRILQFVGKYIFSTTKANLDHNTFVSESKTSRFSISIFVSSTATSRSILSDHFLYK